MIDAGLYSLLAANSGVTSQLANGAQSIFAVEGPDDAAQMPYVVYSFVGGSFDPDLQARGVATQRVQIDAFAFTASGGSDPGSIAAAIRTAVIAAVNGWQAKLSDGTGVLSAILLNPGTDFCTEQRVFRCMCEFYVKYTLP